MLMNKELVTITLDRDLGIHVPSKIIKSIKTRLGMNVELEILKIREKLGLNNE